MICPVDVIVSTIESRFLMAGRTKEVSEATRRDLLCAAITLFLEKGVAGVTLEQIARAAGYTRGAVYHHFKNKAEILEELLESVQLPMEEFFSDETESERNNPMGALQTRCERAMEVAFTDECRMRIHTILWHRCEFVEELNPVFRKIVQRDSELIAMCEHFFTRARDLGHLRDDMTPFEAAFALHAFATGLYRSFLREPWRGQIQVNVKLNLDVFFSGLRRRR